MMTFNWTPPQPVPPTHYPAVDGQEIFLFLGDVLIMTANVGPEDDTWAIPVNAPGTYHLEVWATYEVASGTAYSELSASDDFTIQGTAKTPTPTDSMIAPPSNGHVEEAA